MNLIKDKWSEKDYLEFIDYLLKLSEDSLKKFNEKIYNDKEKIGLGISLKTLRKISNEILKGDSYSFINVSKKHSKYIEEVMVQGFVIAKRKESIEEKFKNIDAFVPKISNWAICDSFVPTLKCVKDYRDEYLKYIEKYLNSAEEFYLRFYIVSLLNYYIDDEYIDYVIEKLEKINSDYYYVKMAVAWTLAEAYISYSDKVILVLRGGKLDKFTNNKLISKICDSYRVGKDEKANLKKFRK